MNFEATFPLRLYLNLARADERRQTVEAHFYERGLNVRRQAAVNGNWLRDARGYPDEKRRALALTKRLVLRRAMCAGVPAVFFFEDDVVLHPKWRERLSQIELPADWGVFMLGAHHEARPRPIAPGLVRCTHAVDHHAIGFHAERFRELRVLWRGSRREQTEAACFSDQRLARQQHRIPTYAAWPNLAWQSGHHAHTNCDAEGRQRWRIDCVAGLEDEMEQLRSRLGERREKDGEGDSG